MAKDTIEIIRDTELEAVKTAQNAEQEAERIIAEAKIKADKIIADRIKETDLNSKNDLNRARNSVEKKLEASEKDTAIEVEKLKKSAFAMADEVTGAIIKKIV